MKNYPACITRDEGCPMNQDIDTRQLPLRKLDFVTDHDGFISMIIYNTHPDEGIFIAPKYFPDKGDNSGKWYSHETGRYYNRFEYYWNLKQSTEGQSAKVYDVDKNPDHVYATDVFDRFNQNLVLDPCHGVYMYVLPRTSVYRYHDAKAKYRDFIESIPTHARKFGPFLKRIGDTFDIDHVGITGSYLYDLYQDFSDLNFVFYDDVVDAFHDLLVMEKALLNRQEIDVKVPAPDWQGWLVEQKARKELLPALKFKGKRQFIIVKNRFIGSMQDARDPRTRAGFWLANTVDVYPHGTFTKKPLGIAVITGHVSSWVDDMPSGHYRVDKVTILGIHPRVSIDVMDEDSPIDHGNIDDLARNIQISAVQVIGEFCRMFLYDEEFMAFGLLEEITTNDATVPVHELLVGGREIGGWIFPVSEINPR